MDQRPKFGNRFLNKDSDVYSHNAWDNVEWDEEFKNEVIEKISRNSSEKLSEDRANELETNASKYWNDFYQKHENKFFKDRHWILTEFPELMPNDTSKTILELGCGVGNTVFPLIEIDTHKTLFIYCCDFSAEAIKLIHENPLYDTNRCKAFVFDITNDDWQSSSLPIKLESLDIVTMIFVLSAIDPKYHKNIIKNIIPFLKPNGLILFRDYGEYDMAQIRFNNGRCIKERFYMRGDGTCAYFFNDNEINELFTTSTNELKKINLHVDKRLQINRANKKKMYRVWIQGIFQKKND